MDYQLPSSQSPPADDSNLCQLASQNVRHLAAESVFSNEDIQWTTLSSHNQGGYHPDPAAQTFDNNPVSYQSGLPESHMTVSFGQHPKPVATQPHQLPIYDYASGDYLQPMAPLPKLRKRKAPTLCLNDWEPIKARAIELYVALDLGLPEVKKKIEEEFKPSGFTATIRQYRTRLSEWGHDKNVKPKEMMAIVRKRQKRRLVEVDKGELEFELRGSMVKSEKIDRWMKRKGITDKMLYAPSPAPFTPAALSAWTVSERGSPAPSSAEPMCSPTPIITSPIPSPVQYLDIHFSASTMPAGFQIHTLSEYPLRRLVFKELPILQLQAYIDDPTNSLALIRQTCIDPETLLKTTTETRNLNSMHPLIGSLLPLSAFKDGILGNGLTIDQTGLLSLLYLISNSFPAESQSKKVYQLLKTQGRFSPNIFQALQGLSDSVLENLFKLAVEAEDLPMVKNLIKAGANINANNCKFWYFPFPWTPLQFACLKGNIPLAQELIAAGSDIDIPQSGWKLSAILLSIYGHEHVAHLKSPQYLETESLVHLVQVLFDGGASVNAVDTSTNYTTKLKRDWKQPLDPVFGMHEILVEQHSPLTLASKFGYKELVHFLILKGADVQFRMDGKSSALRLSLYKVETSFDGYPKTLTGRLQDLDEYEPEPESEFKSESEPEPEYEWEPEIRSTIVSIAHGLMRAGADLNDHDPCDGTQFCEHSCLECYSILDLAVLVESTELIDLMLYAGAKTTYHSLDLALQVKNFEIFCKLFDEGAAIPDLVSSEMQDEISPFLRNEDPRNAKDIYLHRVQALVLAAIRLGAISKLDSLIRSMNSSTINLLDGCAGLTTAIEHCCKSGHSETLQYLLKAGLLPKAPLAAVFGRSVLFSIIHDQRALDLLLENGADVNAGDDELGKFKVPILVAIKKRDVELVRKLIRAGAKLEGKQFCPDGCDDRGRLGNMLVAAIRAGNLAVTEEILGRVDINGTGAYYFQPRSVGCCAPITMAIMKRNWALVDRLRRGGANVYSMDPNLEVVRCYTPLWAAAYQKHFKLAKSLIEAGAEVNDRMAFEAAVDDDELLELFVAKISSSRALDRKFNALHFALHESIRQNSIAKVELILKSQLADLATVEGSSILQEALTSKYEVRHTLLDMLLAAGADPKTFVSGNETVLLSAIATNDAKSVQMLLEADDMSSAGLRPGMDYSPAQLAAKKNNLKILQLLLAYGIDPNAVAPAGQFRYLVSVGSAIQIATREKNFDIVRTLLAHSANPDAITKTIPDTALQIASRDGDIAIAELLLSYGADVNSPPAEEFGATALQFAALGGYLGIASLLIEKGADINAPPAKRAGRTALEAAAEYGRIDMVQLLKISGADISGEGEGHYRRALTRAFENGHLATWRLLQSYSSP